jgi:hypothetical protein
MPSKSSIKSLTVVNEPVFVAKDGSVQEYIPKEIVGYREAYAASLHLVFKHVADFHTAMLEIIAEKYGHDVDELVKVVQEDSRIKDMTVNPVISGLNIITQKDVPAVAVAVAVAEPVVAEAPLPVAAEAPKKKLIVKRKTPIAPASTDS